MPNKQNSQDRESDKHLLGNASQLMDIFEKIQICLMNFNNFFTSLREFNSNLNHAMFMQMNRPGCRDNVDIFNLTNFDEDTSSDDDTIVSSSEFIDDSDFSDDEDHPYMFDMCDIGYDTDYDSYCSDEDLQ